MNVFATLQANRQTVANIPDKAEPGVYAIYANDLMCLPTIEIPPTGLVYIGKSKDLEKRNHFKAKDSGFHSPRRSFGAILKETLDLKAMPRGTSSSDTNYKCFKFTNEGEMRITKWMKVQLEYAIFTCSSDIDSLETQLITENSPPLNLNKWRNPQKKHIEALRKICKEEAKVLWLERLAAG